MDQARAALQQAETNLAAVQQQRDALRETLQGKEAELQRLHMRLVAKFHVTAAGTDSHSAEQGLMCAQNHTAWF